MESPFACSVMLTMIFYSDTDYVLFPYPADWCYDNFEVRPSVQAISDMLKPAEISKISEFVKNHPEDGERVRNRVSSVHALNETLSAWERTVSERPGTCLTDDVLVCKAKEIGERMQLPANFNYNKTTWLAKFKKQVSVILSSEKCTSFGVTVCVPIARFSFWMFCVMVFRT